ncbi:MAG: DUF2029 domain-containing protein [Chloroflexi bacterium]|nr:DUF2029 domain-containing protein [Chloroflexota bacterium]
MNAASPLADGPGFIARWARWLDAAGWLAALTAWAYTFAKVAAGLGAPSDFSAYYLAGKAHTLGLDYYQRQTIETLGRQAGLSGDFGPFLYPPLVAGAMSPLSALDYPSARWLWAAVCLACFVVGLLFLLRATALQLPAGYRGPLFALLSLFPPVADDALKGQVSAILLLLLAGVWLAERRDRAGVAGILVASAASIKLAPTLFLLTFIWRRQWRALAATLLVGTALAISSLAVAGIDRNLFYLREQLPYAGLQIGSLNNVSLPGLISRLASMPGPSGQPATATAWGAPATVVVWAILGAILAYGLWRHRHDVDAGFGLMAAAMLLASPSSQGYTLVLALLPLAALATRAQTSGSRLLWDMLLVSVLLLIVPAELVPSVLADRAQLLTNYPLVLAASAAPTLGLLLLSGSLLIVRPSRGIGP